jgi:hypothetical protein
VSLSRSLLVTTSIPLQLLKRRFGKLIEEEPQCKSYQRRKRESTPTKGRIAVQ